MPSPLTVITLYRRHLLDTASLIAIKVLTLLTTAPVSHGNPL